MLTNEQLHELAANWLALVFPGDFTRHEEYVLQTLVEENYPTGWDGFVEDSAYANAVS